MNSVYSNAKIFDVQCLYIDMYAKFEVSVMHSLKVIALNVINKYG